MVYKSLLFVTAVIFLCGLVDCGYTDCGSVAGTIVSVEISKCLPNAKRCSLKRNTNVTMDIMFTSNTDSNTLQAVVHGEVLGVPVPFDLPNPDGCKDSDITCPIKANTTYKYTTTMPILPNYPRVTVDIKWELKKDDETDIICALIPAKII